MQSLCPNALPLDQLIFEPFDNNRTFIILGACVAHGTHVISLTNVHFVLVLIGSIACANIISD